jgi:protein TonB
MDGTSDSPELTAPSRHDADAGLIQLFRTQNIEVEGERRTTKKKRMIVVAISAGWIVIPLCIIIPLLHHGAKAVAKQSVQPPPVASETQLITKPPAPPASEPSTQDKTPATTERHQTTDNQPAQEEEGANSAQLQTKMMHDQLTAPTQISEDAKKQVAENGPPPASIGAAGAEGLGGNGAIDGVFNGHAQPAIKVVASRPLAISSGVAAGMLIKMTPPIYPTVARAAHVSGTVVLKATISKDGTIRDLHVVNGPQMLQHAALDAVRTWRYKPYKLNNEPTEVETTIDVVFTLGG